MYLARHRIAVAGAFLLHTMKDSQIPFGNAHHNLYSQIFKMLFEIVNALIASFGFDQIRHFQLSQDLIGKGSRYLLLLTNLPDIVNFPVS